MPLIKNSQLEFTSCPFRISENPVNVYLMPAVRKVVPRIMGKAVYCTCWDGDMRVSKLTLLWGYCIRGKKRLLVATLTAIAIVFFLVLPALALSQLSILVRPERLLRPQTSVPAPIGLDYKTANQVQTEDHTGLARTRILRFASRTLRLMPTLNTNSSEGSEL